MEMKINNANSVKEKLPVVMRQRRRSLIADLWQVPVTSSPVTTSVRRVNMRTLFRSYLEMCELWTETSGLSANSKCYYGYLLLSVAAFSVVCGVSVDANQLLFWLSICI